MVGLLPEALVRTFAPTDPERPSFRQGGAGCFGVPMQPALPLRRAGHTLNGSALTARVIYLSVPGLRQGINGEDPEVLGCSSLVA